MDLGLYSLFEVNLENSVANDLLLAKQFNFPPSQYLYKPYYYYEYILDKVKEIQKEEEERQKEQDKEMNRYKSKNYNNFKNPMQNFSMPKINIPKF